MGKWFGDGEHAKMLGEHQNKYTKQGFQAFTEKQEHKGATHRCQHHASSLLQGGGMIERIQKAYIAQQIELGAAKFSVQRKRRPPSLEGGCWNTAWKEGRL